MMFKQDSLLFIIAFSFVISFSPSGVTAANNDSTLVYYYNQATGFRNINPDSSIYYGKKTIELSESKSNYNLAIDAYILLIRSYQKKGDITEAYKYCKLADSLVERHNLTDKKAKVYTWYGNVYQSLGFSSKALEYLFKAQKLSSDKKTEETLLYYTSLVYYDLGEFDKCREYANQSIAIKASNKVSTIDVVIRILLSNTYNNYDSINYYLEKAMALTENNPEMIYEKVAILNDEALLYDMVNKLSESKKKYLQAIEIAKRNQFTLFLANIYNNYAYTLMYEKDFDSSTIVLNKALAIAKQFKDIDLQASIYDTYSDLLKEMGEYEKSLEYLRKSIKKRESYRKQQQVQTSLFLSAVFDTEQKEKELLLQEAKLNRFRIYMLAGLILILLLLGIVLYFRQKVSLNKIKMENLEKEKSLEIADALIKGKDEERKRLAMDLHDGLGAKLGALKLKVDTVLYEDPNYYDLTSSIDDIARNVRELSHRMLPSRLAELGLIHSLKNLIRSVNASSEMEIEFETNVTINLDDKFQVNLYYLIYELINNSIKHSHGKNLIIQLFIGNENLTLSAEDDGVGFDVSKKGDGHGLNNIRQRVDYLNGTLLIESEEGQGSVFMIEIPMI